jgi:DNA-binding response OmpR family regulator
MNFVQQGLDDLIVVDPRLDDYDPMIAEIDSDSLRIAFFSTGEEALRQANAYPSTVWIVNARLPDMPGVGLLGIVRRRSRRSYIFLVGDAYSADDELAARIAGANAYLCKPPTAEWLDGCRTCSLSSNVRAGPGFS